jgi:predicted dehydrogenase
MPNPDSRSARSIASAESAPRIAVIGCGAVAEMLYLPALAKYPPVLRNLILVDRNELRTQQLAAKFNVRDCLADYRDVLDSKVDGVIVAVPSHLHHPVSMAFLAKGVHVLCEKPLADSADKAREMVEQADRMGAELLANYQRRLYASYRKVKELLTSRTLGEPLAIRYFEGEEFRWPTVSGFYFDTKVSSRGVLLDRGAHVLDLVCWWLGGKPKLTSSQNDSFGGREAVAQIQFEHNGCRGEVKLSLLGKFPCVFSVECEAGTIEGDVYDFKSLVLTTKSGRKRRLALKAKEKRYTDFGHTMVTDFLDVISKGKEPLVTGGAVLDSVEWIDECYQAASRFNMPWYETLEVRNDR